MRENASAQHTAAAAAAGRGDSFNAFWSYLADLPRALGQGRAPPGSRTQ